MISPLAIIDKYYSTDASDTALRNLLLHHSWQVASMALRCAARHPELPMDRQLIFSGALLHDIGVYLTHAPSIHCHGELHYLMHGFAGAQLLRIEGLEAEARICERHTGTGLSREAILDAELPIEACDYFPETLEEKLICYADKFFSKSKPHRILSFEGARQSLVRFGMDGVKRFEEWNSMFGGECW